jgi:uncharacterized protein involved in outer membrane biogenesis
VRVQNTLLGIAIALILALVAALVGPYFVNWSDHRAFFEAEASRLIGLQVRVTGPIKVGVLPTPSVQLGGIEIGPAGEASRLRARSLGIELGLGSLMRGEIRAVEMRLVGPEFNLGLNTLGQIDWPAMTLAGETLSIDRLAVEDGRAVLTDAASASRLVLDKLWFAGEVRSLTGPVRGEGAFVSAGALYGYRVTVGRMSEEGLRVRLNVDTSERPLNIEAEGMLAFERGTPRFDGNLTLARPAGSVLASGKTVAQEPWRVSGKVKGTSASALLEVLEFQYGPEERAVKLSGAAELKFGARPRLQGALSARQVDVDRLIATPETPRRLPLATIQTFAEMFGASLRPSLPVNLAVSVDAATVGGAVLQNVGTDLRSDGDAWYLDKLEFRAPGFSQVRLSGRLDSTKGLGFSGAASLDANDPKTLVAWLVGRPGTGALIKPWHARGEITLGADRIAVERLSTEFERGTIEGRVAYVWGVGERPARLEADLSAGELDIDALLGFGESALTGMGLDRPREVALGLEIGRAKLAGFEARNASARLKFDASGIVIERLSVADFGNAKVDAKGRIDTTTASPGGTINLDLDARELSGIIALAEKFAAPLAEPLRRLAGRHNNANLRATVSLQRAGTESATAKLDIAGRIGILRIELAAGATGRPDAFVVTDLRALSSSDIRLGGKLESDDGGVLLSLIGLDRLAADKRPARLTFAASGPLSRELRVDGNLTAGAIDAAANGVVRLFADQPAVLALDRIAGTIGGSKVQGKLALTYADPIRVEGAMATDAIDLPAVIAPLAGLRPGSKPGAWSTEPFAQSASDLTGRIEIKSERAVLSPLLSARQFRTVARFGVAQLVFEDVEGEIAGGRLGGRLAFASSPEGLAARGQLGLSGANAAALVPSANRAISGRLAFQAEIEGAGLSPAAFMGSLVGTGTVTLEKAQIARLNPRAFEAVIRAVDLGIPSDANRIRDFMTTALDNGDLAVPQAEGALTIAAGQVRLRNVVTRANGADLAIAANFDLAGTWLDATATLTGMPAIGADIRPTVVVNIKGPLAAPKRSIDANSLTGWLALRAVEQQSKRIDAMERARQEAVPTEPMQPASLPERGNAAPEDTQDTRSITSPDLTGGVPPADALPPLPPPVTIGPAPKPRAPARAASNPPARPAPARNPPPAPAPNWPFDLFGPQH